MQEQKLVNSYVCWLYTFAEKSNASSRRRTIRRRNHSLRPTATAQRVLNSASKNSHTVGQGTSPWQGVCCGDALCLGQQPIFCRHSIPGRESACSGLISPELASNSATLVLSITDSYPNLELVATNVCVRTRDCSAAVLTAWRKHRDLPPT